MFCADHINAEITIGKHICTKLYLNINSVYRSQNIIFLIQKRRNYLFGTWSWSYHDFWGFQKIVFYTKNNREIIFLWNQEAVRCYEGWPFLMMWPGHSDYYHLDRIEVERLHKSTFHPIFAPSVSPPPFHPYFIPFRAANKKRSVHWISNFARSFSSLLFDLLWNSKMKREALDLNHVIPYKIKPHNSKRQN